MAEKTLSVLSGGRKFGPLAREDVSALLGQGRLAPSDLVSAVDGPWMRLEDFLGLSKPPAPIRALPVKRLAPAYSPTEDIPEVDEPVMIEPFLSDSWQVIVRKIPSTSLSVVNIQQLLEAREVTMDSKASHESWEEGDWRPIRNIGQLARLLVPPPPPR
jgi:hypothetical protein